MRTFLFVLFVGLVIRVFLIGNTGFVADISFWKSWSLAAIDHGVVWTAHNTNINYPPGFIYVLWLMGKLYSLIGNPHDYNNFWRENNFGFLFASKSIAILSDVIIAFLIYFFSERFAKHGKIFADRIRNLEPTSNPLLNKRTAESLDTNSTEMKSIDLASKKILSESKAGWYCYLPIILSSIFFLNPIVILDSAWWGQVDSFGILFTLVAIILLFYRHPLAATSIFTVGTLMKLQNIIFIPLFFLFIFRYFDLTTTVKSLFVVVVTFFLVSLPFLIANDMNQVLYLLTLNSDYFPWLSLNAHNLWWIVAGAKGMEISDKITVLGILNAKTTGLLIFSSLYLLSCILLYKKPTPRNFLLSLIFAIFSFFLFTTQSHERYSYPVVVLLLMFYPLIERHSIKNSKHEARNTKQIRMTEIQNSKQKFWSFGNLKFDIVSNFGFRISNLQLYFWFIYILLTITIFFNMHTGLVFNYPQNGLNFLTQLTTRPLTIINSYFLIILFFLLLPYIFSQINPLFSVLCSMLFVLSLTALNFSYLVKGKVSLTSFKPILIKQDYGGLQVNKSVNSFTGWKAWNRLSNNYFYYRKGFGSHANSNLVFDIDKKFRKFSTDFGIDTEANTDASVIFKIYGDGKELFTSQKMGKFDFPNHTDVDVTGIKYLGLIVNDAGDGINNDHVDWLNPVLYR